MRQRTTFFHHNENGIEPTDLKITGRSFVGPDVTAVREDRLTLSLDELPYELQSLLHDVNELHIRWASPFPHESIGPWNSRLSPGLHLFYTPLPGEEETTETGQVCRWLQTTFGVSDCVSPEVGASRSPPSLIAAQKVLALRPLANAFSLQKSFTRLPYDRFSHSTAFQFYSTIDSLDNFGAYVAQFACGPSDSNCKAQIGRLARATSLDLSYDAISQAAKITATWPHENQPISIESSPGHRVEVGILTNDAPPHLEEHELGVSGLLTVLGDNDKPSPTLFAFPARHRQAGSSFSSDFLEPTGLHPTMQLQMSSSRPPLDDSYCSLHAHLTLPRTIFADKYQLGDDLFLSSKNLTSLRYMSQPVDLEAPDYVMGLWGSTVLLELQPPSNSEVDQSWTAEVPLHLRYLAPAEGGYRSINVPYPAVFWACTVEEGTKFPSSPFERANLGYDGLFGPRTSLWHVDPHPAAGGRLVNEIRVPVLDLSRSTWVNTGTAAVVLLGFAWIAWKLLSVLLQTGYGAQKPGDKSQKKDQ